MKYHQITDQKGRNVRVGDCEGPCTCDVEAVEKARDEETAEAEHLDQRGHHDEGHSLNSPARREGIGGGLG